jgi:hypothetical protein
VKTIGLSVAALASISNARARKREGLARGAVDLRRAAHRIRVLDTTAVRVGGIDVTSSEQLTRLFADVD